MTIFIFMLVVGIGMMVPAQVGVNGKLAVHFGSPLIAALISFLVGFSTMICLVLLGGHWPRLQTSWADIPPVYLTGGLLGAYMVAASAYVGPKLGATAFLSIVVASQLFASVLFDTFGLAGFKVRHISWQQIVGLGFLFVGALMVISFRET